MNGWRPFEPSVAGSAQRSRRVLQLQLLALMPVVMAAIFNTGWQYLQALALDPSAAGDEWRGRLAQLFGANPAQPGLYDLFVAGIAHLLPMLALALLCGGLWERIIAARCGRPLELGFIPIALIFTLLLPGAAPAAHILFGMSAAIILGKGIFGGDGKTFLSPALVGFALLQVSFPGAAGAHPLWSGMAGYAGSDAIASFARAGEAALADAGITAWRAFVGATPGAFGTTSELAVVIGAALLLYTRLISWRLLAAQIIGLGVMATVFNLSGAETGAATLTLHWHLLLGGFLFGAVFLACDPVASCCTNPGRWIQGFLIGALVVLIRVVNSTHPDAVIPALLLGSIVAPLIDQVVIMLNSRQRAQRNV